MLYFAMVDRFAEPANDGAVDPADYAFTAATCRASRNLDHLDALGVTHLWVSPVFKMRTEKIDEWGSLHGYWVRDLAEEEPRFGSVEALQALSDGLHARQMELVLDMVWNRTDYDAPLLTEHPDWYHEGGDIQDWNDPVERVTGRVHGLRIWPRSAPRSSTTSRSPRAGWTARPWIASAWTRWAMPLRSSAASMAPSTRTTPASGPSARTSPATPRVAATLGDGGFDAVFDFPLRYAMIDVFCKDAPLGRLSTLSLDRLYADPSALVTFLDNHDVPRVTTECAGRGPRGQPGADLPDALPGDAGPDLGHRGVAAGRREADNRRDMPWSSLSDPDVARNLSDIRGLADLRTDWPVLQDGRTVILQQDADAIVVGRFGPRQAARLTLWRGAPPDADVPWPLAEGAERVQRRRWPGPHGDRRPWGSTRSSWSRSRKITLVAISGGAGAGRVDRRVAGADREGLVVVGQAPGPRTLGSEPWSPRRRRRTGEDRPAGGHGRRLGGSSAAPPRARCGRRDPTQTCTSPGWGEVAVDAQARLTNREVA